jgi:hypothetical protein
MISGLLVRKPLHYDVHILSSYSVFQNFQFEGVGLNSAQFLGPVSGDRILCNLKMWIAFYNARKFPYPKPLNQCYTWAAFDKFEWRGQVGWWRLTFEAFSTKVWVKREFFDDDTWTINETGLQDYLIVTSDVYNRYENNVDELSDDDDGSNQSEVGSEDEDTGDRDHEAPVRKKRGRPTARASTSKKAAQERLETDEEDNIVERLHNVDDSSDDDDEDTDSAAIFKSPNDDDDIKAIPPKPAFAQGIPRGENRNPLENLKVLEPVEIVLKMTKKMWEQQLKCMNIRRDDLVKKWKNTIETFTYGEVETYYGILALMSIIQLQNQEMYWKPKEVRLTGLTLPNLTDIMSWDRFKKFKSCRKYYEDDDEDEDNDVAWKIRKMFIHFKSAAEDIMKYPFEVLVVDEAMMKCTSTRNPLKRVMPNKPISCGFKFWILACKETGLIVKIHLDSHSDLNAADCKARGLQHGFYGEVVLRAVRDLPGRHYALAIDKLFQSLPLTRELLNLDIRCVGPIKTDKLRKITAPNILLSTAKHAKPTLANPKGTRISFRHSKLTPSFS